MFRVYIKDRLDLGGKSIGNFRVTSFKVKRDCLAKATSSIRLEKEPTEIKEGDILTLYDNSGRWFFRGVIIRQEKELIECSQINSLFNDSWKWEIPEKNTIEESIKSVINNHFRNSDDVLLTKTFYPFELSTISDTVRAFPSQNSDFVMNFEKFTYDVFDKYSVRLYFDFDFQPRAPSIEIGLKQFPKITIGDNNNAIQNMSPIVEVYETNKLIIYSREKTEDDVVLPPQLREVWYASKNGITNDPSEESRLPKINTKIVFTDDEVDVVIAQHLRDEMYNHKLTLDLVIDNKLYDFFSFDLGQEFDIWKGQNYFNTILTAYELEQTEDKKLSIAKLTFGKVRTSLVNKVQVAESEW